MIAADAIPFRVARPLGGFYGVTSGPSGAYSFADCQSVRVDWEARDVRKYATVVYRLLLDTRPPGGAWQEVSTLYDWRPGDPESGGSVTLEAPAWTPGTLRVRLIAEGTVGHSAHGFAAVTFTGFR